MSGYVDESDLAEWLPCQKAAYTRGIDARVIAQHYGAHVDDALAVLNRDDRFRCLTPGDEFRSFSRWTLAPIPPHGGQPEVDR